MPPSQYLAKREETDDAGVRGLRMGIGIHVYVSAAVRDEATELAFELVGDLAMKGKSESVSVFEVAAQ